MKNKKKILIIVIGILISIGVIAGISYAWWTYTGEQESVNKITSDCLRLELKDETSAIHLERAYPLTDEEASRLKPYVFTIKNTCNTTVEYDISLEIMNVSNRLNNEYIALSLDYGNKVLLNTLTPTENTYNQNAIEGRYLTSNTLNGGESERYSLRLWMDEHVTIEDDAMNKNFLSKIVINASMSEAQEAGKDNTIMAYKDNNTAFWSQRGNITKVIITKDTSVPSNASYIYDVSASGNGSVMAYLVPNTSDTSTYTMYLKSKNGITANTNSSYLFNNFTKLESIEGLEYLDTSKVIDMHGMFSNDTNLTNIDVSSFDTSNVTRLRSMFYNNSALTSVDVSNFDTNKVGDMSHMFYNNTKLVNLNISSFDTSNATDMSNMFYGMPTTAKVYVRNTSEQQKILNLTSPNRPASWTKSNVIPLGTGTILRLAELIGSSATNANELLKNDIDKLVNNKEAMDYLKENLGLVKTIKASKNYTEEVIEKFLGTNVITNAEKYNAGLPCYMYLNGQFTQEILEDVTVAKVINTASTSMSKETNYIKINVSLANNYMVVTSNNAIDFSNYNHLFMEYYHYTNYGDLTGTMTLGISDNKTNETFLASNLETYNSNASTTKLITNITSGSYYLKMKVDHGSQVAYNTACNHIYKIGLY